MNTEKVISRDNDYILHTYGRSQVVLAEGEGMTARDADGKSYLDFTSGIGVNSLGYCHPAWVRAVADQAATLQHTSNLYYTAPDGKLAKKLCRRTGLDAVFFGNSGAEANEGAIKCARKYSVDTYGESRNKVITLVNSFHGRTLATLTATGQDVFHHDFGPFPGNFDYVPAGDFAALEKAADKDTCAVMMELVQGEGGVVALDADYVARVAAFCREKDILVIVDEVQTGVGRTGTFLCCEHYNLKPDVVTLAKGLGGGLPIGAVLMNEKVAEGMINISMNTAPYFEDGKAEGNVMIVNESINNYPQQVEFIRNDTGEQIYQSKAIPVGSKIECAALDVELPAGSYECTAMFHNLDPVSGEIIGTAGAIINITIKN